MRVELVILGLLVIGTPLQAEPSVARQWNEALLAAIRIDYARPTVHARNLFHVSIALYDAWAAYDPGAETYLLGKTVGEFTGEFSEIPPSDDPEAAKREAMSHAAYRLLVHRFARSPGAHTALPRFDALMAELGYDAAFTATDYADGSPAALGNYIGQSLIAYGLQDGANEQQGYSNLHYLPFNPTLGPTLTGNRTIIDPNFWQPLSFEVFVDQSRNVVPGDAPPFVSPEWGAVVPFALTGEVLTTYLRGDNEYPVYHDPGPPPHIDTRRPGATPRHLRRSSQRLSTEEYQWGFALVAAWSSHLDPTDGVLWDISPGSTGNITTKFPETLEEYQLFFDLLDGGDAGQGYAVNPHTGQPYEPQLVPRGDYVRVLAEFWADGPDSETPPGHWFTILNHVSDHPLLEKRFRGRGPVLDDLEWDVKAYFVLGGAVHDAAVAAWGIKGWYDYVRPVSAIRWMCDRGQSTRPELPSYDRTGIVLIEGLVELVEEGDPLDGGGLNAGKIKLRAWRGPEAIADPATDVAGVDWILAENWWPYQRPTFVTPPFAGYVSGHSTFSRAAAEVMTLLTGDEFFPGGMGEFHAGKNEFLVFEEGPSVDVTMQWATYRDASDQTSLSRIWGGIHPPADDIPGRRIGRQIGVDAFHLAEQYFGPAQTAVEVDRVAETPGEFALAQSYPNPFNGSTIIRFALPRTQDVDLAVFNTAGQRVVTLVRGPRPAGEYSARWDGRDGDGHALGSGVFLYHLQTGEHVEAHKLLLLH